MLFLISAMISDQDAVVLSGPPAGAKVWVAPTRDHGTGPGTSLQSGQQGRAHYPEDAIRRHEQGKTVATATVGLDGHATRCWIAQSSGSASLDEETCRIVLTSVTWTPAKDAAGSPIESEVRVPVNWRLPK